MNRSRMRYLLFSFPFLFTSCASDYKYMQTVDGDPACISKLAPDQFQTSWYHASVDVVGNHISGLLLIKNMPDSSQRVVFTNEAGMTFFDFGFAKNGEFRVFNIIKQLDRKPVIQTLQKDFRLILGLPFQNASYHVQTRGDEVFYGVRRKNETSYFITTKDCASLRRLELGSARKRKVTVHITGSGYPRPDKIELLHNTFNMQIKLTRLEKE
jgi:hypothetical protein